MLYPKGYQLYESKILGRSTEGEVILIINIKNNKKSAAKIV